ncbi:zinc finger protein RFP [Anolis carolinensis]|uniref:zinc finger protein RFP n=1 Tax=Anolis carolinensis TaxID=28377 RepID=UPI002F2B8641
MAAASVVQDLCEEATCSICFDYFKDPVTITCGHNFCRACLTQSWEKSGNTDASCPFCRETVLQRKLTTNWQLANIIAAVKKLNPNYEGGKQEPWKSVYEDYESRISLVDDKEHHDHRQIALKVAAPDSKNQEDEEMEKILRKITQDCWFLEDQTKHIWAQIEEMKHQIGRKTNNQELSFLENLILKMQDELLQTAKSLSQRSEKKEAAEKSVAFPPELKWKIQEISDQNPDLTTIMKWFQGNLDPDSAPSFHFLSDGHKSGKYEAEPQGLPDNPGQFCNPTYVSGFKDFITRSHAEEYAVRKEGIWPVKMATKPVRGKGHLPIGPKERIWPMGKWTGIYPDTSLPSISDLSLSEKTKGVQRYLNGLAGQVGFFDGEMGGQIDAILEVPISAVSVLPFFYM